MGTPRIDKLKNWNSCFQKAIFFKFNVQHNCKSEKNVSLCKRRENAERLALIAEYITDENVNLKMKFLIIIEQIKMCFFMVNFCCNRLKPHLF